MNSMQKKKIYHGCEGQIEKSVPRVHSLTSLGKPRDARQKPSGRIFLSTPHTHDRFWYSCTPDKEIMDITLG